MLEFSKRLSRPRPRCYSLSSRRLETTSLVRQSLVNSLSVFLCSRLLVTSTRSTRLPSRRTAGVGPAHPPDLPTTHIRLQPCPATPPLFQVLIPLATTFHRRRQELQLATRQHRQAAMSSMIAFYLNQLPPPAALDQRSPASLATSPSVSTRIYVLTRSSSRAYLLTY